MGLCDVKPASATTLVFQVGKLSVKIIDVKTSKKDTSKPTSPLLIFAPTVEGTYPVLLFLHGFCILNTWYTQLLNHISSHGFIVVAPGYECHLSMPFKCCCGDDVASAAAVTDWLFDGGFAAELPDKVHPNLKKLALVGHSKGGKTAFALALAKKSLNFSAVIGIDPVAGRSPSSRTSPKILNYIPWSFDLNIPIAVIGTGLGNKPKGVIPPFAPDGVNHAEFFNESKPTCSYFLAKDYGHTDMLDDSIARIASLVAQSGIGSRDLMRRGVGGIVVAFLNAYLNGDKADLSAIVDQPSIAPIVLDPVILIDENNCKI